MLPLAAFAVLWLDLIRLLSTQWEAREQYAYGWFVPILALGLFIKKWPSRPLPGLQDYRPRTKDQGPVVSGPLSVVTPQWSVVGGLLLLCLLLLPLRVIYDINQDWPLISWVYTTIVVALTLYAIYLAAPPALVPGPWSAVSGPRSLVLGPWSFVSPWVRHFAFPICFILVAVVWPWRIEKGLTQGLMQLDTNITVELLGWLNIPAMQRGNLIELATGTVGVDEACSGIRSFQSTLMAGLFLGELYLLRRRTRLLLVLGGLTLAFGFNVVRTLILSYQANAHGLSAIDKWHDPAGFTIAIACFFCLWAVAVLITKWTAKNGTTKDQGPRTKEPSTTDHGPQTTDHGQKSVVSSPSPPVSGPWSVVSSPRAFMFACGLWSLLCIAATGAWYRSHEIKDAGVFHWALALPEAKPGFEKIQLAPRTIKLLAYDLSTTGKWREEDGSEWSAHFFRWNPRSIQSVIQSRMHRPEVCLPASGFKQLTESELVVFDAGKLKLPFRKYTYEAGGQTIYVFFCQWEDGTENQAGLQASKQAGRLQSVLSGRRLVGQQTLELIVTGSASLAEAETLVRRQLPELIRPSGD